MAHQGLQQVQKQTQSLILAPQLRQSLKILQAPAMELRNTILEELQANPLLEELPMEGVSYEEKVAESEQGDSEARERENDELDFGEDYQTLQKLTEEWREFFAQEGQNHVYTTEDAERRQHFFDSVVSESSLQEHLLAQADLSDMDEQEMEALKYLVGAIDDKGFLTETASEIALQTRLPLRKVQRAVETLKTFDPPGIGCASLQESLLQQLSLRGRGDSLAARILQKHYDLLLRRRIPEMARKQGAPVDEVQAAIEEIASLDPAPGRKFSEDTNRVVTPDVKVEKDNGEWIIHLNNDYIPRLRLNSIYKEMLAKGKLTAKEKEYIQERMRSGKFLINSIEQRQQTIERITREILNYQKAFFEEGVARLRPLTMNQIAQTVGVHETTVSRAIANKYIDTPWGVFDFKYFFTPGYTNGSGESVSNTSIKDVIANLIDAEDPAKPLSDQEVVNILKERDIKIARRTVAKYREELGILPTNLRRRYR
ncbi:MAG: RNA polymerase factor sigma-54 [Opitutales bacterium]